MEQLELEFMKDIPLYVWSIVDNRGEIVMESNRKVPRIYATKQRAQEKIDDLCQNREWAIKMFKLVPADK